MKKLKTGDKVVESDQLVNYGFAEVAELWKPVPVKSQISNNSVEIEHTEIAISDSLKFGTEFDQRDSRNYKLSWFRDQ